MKCLWKSCAGLINPETDRCIMCGRSLDHKREEYIEARKNSVKTDWQTNPTDSQKESRRKKLDKLLKIK